MTLLFYGSQSRPARSQESFYHALTSASPQVGAGWVSKLRWQRTRGATLRTTALDITPEGVRDRWAEVCDWTDATHPTDIQESFGTLMEKLSEIKAAGSKGAVDVVRMIYICIYRYIDI